MIAEARRQFELAWSLAELHLSALVEDDFLWEPADLCWSIRRDDAGAGDGAGAVSRLAVLAAQWRNVLSETTDQDLSAPAVFPWDDDAERTAADTVLWVTVELTKNVAEIGQLRLLRAAGRPAL